MDTKRAAGEEHQPISVDRTIELYRGEWILMKVTEFDADRIPSCGFVLLHSHDRAEISERLATEPPRSNVPDKRGSGPYYIYCANPRSRSGPEVNRAGIQLVRRLKARLEATGAWPKR